MTPDELVEKVAKVIAEAEGVCGPNWQEMWETYTPAARAALRVALEEAAKRVDDMPCAAPQSVDGYWYGYRAALNYSAAAIRALIPKE